MRPRGLIARSTILFACALIASAPLIAALHAAGHIVHAAPLEYAAHDQAAHHEHRPIDGHSSCILCALAKSHPALAASNAPAARIESTPRLATAAASVQISPALAALPAQRAPPLAS